MKSQQINSSTVDNILENGEEVETALEEEMHTSPAKRKILYGDSFEPDYRSIEDRSYSGPLAAVGGGASSAAYTVAGLPGSELAMDIFQWQMSQPEHIAKGWLFLDYAFILTSAAVGYQAVKGGIKSVL